ncbi:MAG: hypothetical protein ACE5ER_02660 [Nitrospinaceae bacterium]
MSGVNFLELILIVAILVVVGVPLFSKLPPRRLFTPPHPSAEEFKHLLVRREEILLAIKELEFDRRTDKVSVEDYESVRQKLEAEVLEVLTRVDALEKVLKKNKGAPKPANSN